MISLDEHTFVSRVQTATSDVFSTMLGMSVEPGEPYDDKGSESDHIDRVTTIISLRGAWVGFGCLECTPRFACLASQAMLCCEYREVNEEVLDAIAEVANMIVGNLKSSLEDTYGAMELSIPTVICGREYRSRAPGITRWLVVPFICDAEEFSVKVALVRSEERHGSSR